MASIHNELRTAGRIAVGIIDALGVEEPESGVERFGETLQPILDVWTRPEWALLRGERLWSVPPSQIAVVGEISQVGVRNPAGSGRITVVEGWWMYSLAAGAIRNIDCTVGASSAVSSTGAVTSRDTRLPFQTGITTLGIATHQAAALGQRIHTVVINNGLYNFYHQTPVVLSPGFDFYIGNTAANLDMAATIWGYERPAFKRELLVRS